ncbi:hypothetical protein QYF61_026069 [Mycteria americana]|uniref:Rna-directed dna polymerase from mobile element jockey-like n=1 Tax=Mycteria americana TaxID=33587 RepID=A0AAN7NC64_MYCAM|nr:hypothetical protein QYF61_026069 [Mycteria americana]
MEEKGKLGLRRGSERPLAEGNVNKDPFDTVSHNILIVKLTKYRLEKCRVRWTENWVNSWAQRVVISSTKSSWRQDTMVHTRTRVADTPEGCATIQRDLDRLEKWAYRKLMKFNKVKRKVLHLVRNNSGHQYLLGVTQLESSSAEKDLGVLVDTKLNMSQQCALATKEARGILGCIRRSVASKSREGILPLYPALYKKGVDLLKQVQYRATKTVKGMEHLSCEERLRELGLFSLEKNRLRGTLSMIRGNRHKQKQMKFHLNTRKHFFTMRVVKHRNRLDRNIVEILISPFLEILKTHLDTVLSNLL